MTKKMTWRLSKLPTPDELRELVKDKIITQDEARDILFRSEDDSERDTKSYQEEIKFLRDLVEKLSSNNRSVVHEYIYTKPYDYTWYKPYMTWCSLSGSSSTSTGGIGINTGYTYSSGDVNSQLLSYAQTSGGGITCTSGSGGSSGTNTSFNDIQTF